ncbi:MAG: hypothetical protein ACJ75B_13450 [Flavisolibacter sp.]
MNKILNVGFPLLFLIMFEPVSAQVKNNASSSMASKRDSINAIVKIAANPDLKGNGLKRTMIGRNYRKEWIEPVSVPVLHLGEAGLVPKKEGGGKETRSLQVEARDGNTWALRSIKKYPSNALAPELRHTLADKVVSDDISASYPYGALSMGVFSEAAGVPYLKDSLVYVGDDPGLGEYRDKYKNGLMLLEEREPSGFRLLHKNAEEKSISTEELVYDLADDRKNQVDQVAVLNARLLDNFVMDFDRHEGQWNWIGVDSNGQRIYFPIPKDRDQVFYTNQGFIPKIMRGKERLPEIQGFRAKVEHMNTFNRTARNFDRTFLNELGEDQWSRQVDAFLQSVNDSVIEAALHKQPKEIQKYEAGHIIDILKKKRNYFREDMMRYYHSLSQSVSVTGTNGKDQFTISKMEDGKVEVSVSNVDSAGSIGTTYYHRIFDPSVTKEIRLYALEGDDRFAVSGGPSKIKIRMIGGPGDDHFTNTGSSKKLIAYDVKFEDNKVEGGIQNKINENPQNNTYTRLGYNYKVVGVGPTAELFATEGFFLGLKFKIITRGFRKDSFATRHVFTASHSLNSSSIHLRYYGDFVGAFGKTDLLIRGDMMIPTNWTNFFGYGNNTEIIQNVKDVEDFYHARYDRAYLALLARTHLSSWASIAYGPSFQYFHLRTEENVHKYVYDYFDPYAFPDSYKPKYFAGGEVHLLLDRRNNTVATTRGIQVKGYFRALAGMNSVSHDLAQTGGSLALYTDFIAKRKVVLATIFGGGHNYGNFELSQAQTLGFDNHLRGFRAQRFAGRSAAYNNTELRIKIAEFNAYLFPTAIGVYGFNDLGRVWADGESSKTWHHGYGGGLWLMPLNKLVVTAYLSFSKEEKALPWATVGFVF